MGKDKTYTKTRDLIKIQQGRNLKFGNEKRFRELLESNNYFDFINGFETLFLVDKKDKNKGYVEGTTIYDFVSINKFDAILSKEIMNSLGAFEKKLKCQVAHNFSKYYCSTLPDTLNYQDSRYYIKPSPSSYDYQYFCDMYDYKKFAFIKLYPDRKSTLKPQPYISYVDKKKQIIDYIAAYNQPPLWVVIKQLMFNDLYCMVGLLDDKVLEPILRSYGLSLNDRDFFLNCLDVFMSLRNHCAHFELANRFRTYKSTDLRLIHNKIPISVVSYLPTGPIYVMKLYDTLMVLTRFTNTKNEIFCVIKYWFICLLKGKNRLSGELLDRMGRRDIREWIKLLVKNY